MEREGNLNISGEAIDISNLNGLLHQVAFIGVREDISDYLRDHMKSGYEFFSLRTYEKIEGNSDKLGIFLFFGKLDDGKYMLSNSRMILYHQMDIVHVNIPGIDTKELEKKMKGFDWNYELNEKEEEWLYAVKEAYDIEESLRTLSQRPNGQLIAMQLWNNHVPLEVMHKPGFIIQIENKLKSYPDLNFTADTSLSEAYTQLKKYQAIEHGLSKWGIDDLNNKNTQSFITRKLLNNEPYTVSIPVSPHLSESIKLYHVIEHSHPGHQVFEEGHEITTLAVKETFADAMNVLSAETDKAKLDWTRKANDFAIIGEEIGKTPRLSIDARPIEKSAVLVAVAQNELSASSGEKSFKIKVINDPYSTRHHEDLFIQFDFTSNEIKAFNKDGDEYKPNQGKYFEKAINSLNGNAAVAIEHSKLHKTGDTTLKGKKGKLKQSPESSAGNVLLPKNRNSNDKGVRL